MNRTYFITGANGYIAQEIIKYLKNKDSNCIIYGLIRSTSQLKESIKDFVDEVYYYDKNKSVKETLEELTKIFKIPKLTIFHLAAHQKLDNSLNTLNELLEDNLILTEILFNAIKKTSIFETNWPKIVSASTFSAFDYNGDFNPDNTYSSLKYYVERISEIHQLHHSVFLRLPDTYGPNDFRNKVYKLVTRDNVKKLLSPANQRINMIHTEDIARAFLYAANKESNGTEIFDLYYKENEIDLLELINLLKVDNVEFGNKEIRLLPPQKSILPRFKPIHNIENILRDI